MSDDDPARCHPTGSSDSVHGGLRCKLLTVDDSKCSLNSVHPMSSADGQSQFEHVRVTRRTQLKAVERKL